MAESQEGLVSRTVTADYTVRWQGEREQVRAGMRGARVQVERRRDGSRRMHGRKRVVALERCAPPQRVLAPRPVKGGVAKVRSAGEKARAKQRRLDGRQRWRESFDHLRGRAIWQAVRDSPLPLAHPHPGSKSGTFYFALT
jgi:hypothetical protein